MTAKTTLLDFQSTDEQQRLAKASQDTILRKLRAGEITSVPDIPQFDIPDNSTLFIASQDVAYLTHGIHEFPAKYIPQIPRWAIKRYCREEETDVVLDPFCGSGTTLVEAKLLGCNSLGVDVDPMGRLLTSVKTTIYDPSEVQQAKSMISRLTSSAPKRLLLPQFPNREHWFNDDVSSELAKIKWAIEEGCRKKELVNFFYICLSSIIRSVSNADPDQIFPEKTKWGMKKKHDLNAFGVRKRFDAVVEKYVPRAIDFSRYCNRSVYARIAGRDARKIDLEPNSVDVAITSPPYINAMDYPRVNQLEMYWLGLLDGEEKRELKKQYVGTEAVPSAEYSTRHLLESKRYESVNKAMTQIYERDKLRAYVVYKFFVDMKQNFAEVYRVLRRAHGVKRGRYVVVIGDGVVRKIPVSTHETLIECARDAGFKLEKAFSYVIRHRTLLITRAEHSGIIDKDWILVFRKD